MRRINYLAALLAFAGLAHAQQIITPVSVTYTGTAPTHEEANDASKIIDGSGLSDTPTATNLFTVTHIGGYDTKWVTTDPGGYPSDFFVSTNATTVIFEFDLGGTFSSIDTLAVWPYHAQGNNISLVELSFSTDGGATVASSQTVSVPQSIDGALAAIVPLAPVAANYITMTVTDNHYNPADPGNGGDRVGLGEIRFAASYNPEPLPPTIPYLVANPAVVTFGETTTLSWKTANADTASLDQGIGNVLLTGSTQVVVNANITYTLTATSSIGSTTASVVVTAAEPGMLVDPSLETSFSGTQATPGSGWFSFGSSMAAVQVDSGFWQINNNDGPKAAYTMHNNENDGGTIYQAITLTNGVTYRLTAAVAQSGGVDKCDGKFAVVFFDAGFGTLLAETNGIVANKSGTFADAFVEFTPTATAIYHVGVRNRGFVPGTGANNDSSTIFFDNIRLIAGEAPPPTDNHNRF